MGGANRVAMSVVSSTAPAVTVTSLGFLPSGTRPYSAAGSDTNQPYVTITIAGYVTVGPGKTQPFSIESSAAMRGTDL